MLTHRQASGLQHNRFYDSEDEDDSGFGED